MNTLSSDIHIKNWSYKWITVNKIHIDHEENFIFRDCIQTEVSLIVNIVKINSVIAKSHENIMHLTEIYGGFMLASKYAFTD